MAEPAARIATPPVIRETAPARPTGDLLRLMAWLSPAFPIGGFSYSHGLEWAIEDGTVRGAATLAAWIGDIIRHGAGRSDAILFAAAWRAANAGDGVGLVDVAELSVAFQPSRERHLEATQQGRAFLSTVAAAWPSDCLAALTALFPPERPITLPVAVALAAASHDVAAALALPAFLAAFAANLVSAGVRAVPLGQTDGQRITAGLAPLIEATAAAALGASLDDLDGAALRADIASMKHETQYTRLFRS